MSSALINLVGIDTYCNLHHLDRDRFETIPECEERDTTEYMTTVSGLISEGITPKQIHKSLKGHLAGHPDVISTQLVRHQMHVHSDSYHPFTVLVIFIVIAVLGSALVGSYLRTRY